METPETKLALQAKDIVYLGQTVAELKKTVEEGFKMQREDMKWMRDNSVLQSNFDKEINDLRSEHESEVKRLEESIKCKADQKDHDKLSGNMTKLLWAFVTPASAAAIGGVIYLIGKYAGH